jgi:hypothetical protein
MKNKKACLPVFWLNILFILLVLGFAFYALVINNPFK